MSERVTAAGEEYVLHRTPNRSGVRLSIVMPAYRATAVLPRAFEALARSDLERDRWELIVAVDGDSMGRDGDRTAEVALECADVVVRLPGKPRGPSYARNRGAEVARGDVLLFVDSDVCVHPDTLRRVLATLDEDPDIDSVFGCYDDAPEAAGVVSKYRNLLHHYVHLQGVGDAETFWAGCGAIRTEVFLAVGMYDEWHFSRPQIEDIELGRRLRRYGHRIRLDPSIQACHLKKWTLAGVLETDLRNRGVPWMRLILHEGPNAGTGTLNVRPIHRACVALTWISFGMLPAALVFLSWWPIVISLATALAVVAMNHGFFRLLGRVAGWRVALGSIPLHLLFYLSNGLSALSGALAYSFVGAPQPPPDVAAFQEVGVETWPPVPSRPKESVWYEHGA